MSDVFREVDEDIRHEQYKLLWDKFGPYAIAVAVVIAGGTLVYQLWTGYVQGQREAESDRFIAALEMVDEGNTEQAIAAFDFLAEDAGDGYASLARFQQAGLLAESGDVEGAVKVYDQISTMGGVEPIFRDLAKIKAAQLLLEDRSRADLQARIGTLITEDNTWRYAAREILAYAAYREGDLETAGAEYKRMANELLAPENLKARAREMMFVIGPQAEDADIDDAVILENVDAGNE